MLSTLYAHDPIIPFFRLFTLSRLHQEVNSNVVEGRIAAVQIRTLS